jgi:hypothetical protein
MSAFSSVQPLRVMAFNSARALDMVCLLVSLYASVSFSHRLSCVASQDMSTALSDLLCKRRCNARHDHVTEGVDLLF